MSATLGLFGAAAVASWLWISALHRSLDTLRQQVAHQGEIPFTLTTLPPQAQSAGLFEPVAASDSPTLGIEFADNLYLAGPGGLTVLHRQPPLPPARIAQLRSGIELPAAPVTALASGRLPGHAAPSLLIATRGEGLLVLSADPAAPLQQLRPAPAPARDLTAVLALASGTVLLGTRNAGLLLFDGNTLRPYSQALTDIDVTTLAGNDADLWIGTRTHGLLHAHGGVLDTLDTAAGLPDNQITALTLGTAVVFAATPLGTAQIADGRITRLLTPGLFATSLALQANTLLLGTPDQGIRSVSLTASRSLRAPPTPVPSASSTPTTLFSGAHTVFSLQQGTLLQRSGGTWQTLLPAPRQTLADRDIAALSFDPAGRLWIGYFNRGLDVLDPATGRADHLEDDHLFCINRIVPDPRRGTMDVATANGLALLAADASHPRERQVLTRRDGLISDQVTDIAFTRSGMTLATPAGLTFFTAAGVQSLYAFQGLVNNHVYTLATDTRTDRILAGTLGGVSLLNNQTVVQNITLKNSALKHNWITALTRVDAAHSTPAWFVGTYGGGVVQMDAAGRVAASPGALPSAVINPNALFSTERHVFAGSLDDGLLVYNRASQHWSQITAGLPSRNVTAFALDRGILYIGTSNGIVRVPEARLP